MTALTLAEAAAECGVSVDTIRRRVRRGELASTGSGRTLRIPSEALGTDDDRAEWGTLFDRLERAVTSLETKAATS